MTVIEFAEKRLNESCLNDDDEAVLYWRAYLDGARAQKKECCNGMDKRERQVAGTGQICGLHSKKESIFQIYANGSKNREKWMGKSDN